MWVYFGEGEIQGLKKDGKWCEKVTSALSVDGEVLYKVQKWWQLIKVNNTKWQQKEVVSLYGECVIKVFPELNLISLCDASLVK